MALQRIVTYFRAAERQHDRIGEWLYDVNQTVQAAPKFPLDQGAALCEAHFFFICWDAIGKAASNLRQNAYGLVTPREVLKKHGAQLDSYVDARDHLEHLDERFPGRSRSDWVGDANKITGTQAGVRRDGFFVFQGQEWDISRKALADLSVIVDELVTGIAAEMTARREAFLRGESAMWKKPRRTRQAGRP
jgi:hypothetical protein